MKLHILFGHRKENYEGEYAPEALAVADELTMENRPDWLSEILSENQQEGYWAALKIVSVHVNGAALMKELYPESQDLQGSVEPGGEGA